MALSSRRAPFTVLRRIRAERLRGEGPPQSQALLDVCSVLADWSPDTRMRFAGDPPRPIELTESALSAYLQEVQHGWAQGIPLILRLASDPREPHLALFYDTEPTSHGDLEHVWFSLPSSMPRSLLETGVLANLVQKIARGFGAFSCYVEDAQLLRLYSGARASERARTAVPPELRRYVPSQPAGEGRVPALELLVPQEFDRRYVPSGIWWINYWDHLIVDALGRARVRRASWSHVTEVPEGGLILVATNEPTDAQNPAHIARLREIAEQLNLRGVQEQYRQEGR